MVLIGSGSIPLNRVPFFQRLFRAASPEWNHDVIIYNANWVTHWPSPFSSPSRWRHRSRSLWRSPPRWGVFPPSELGFGLSVKQHKQKQLNPCKQTWVYRTRPFSIGKSSVNGWCMLMFDILAGLPDGNHAWSWPKANPFAAIGRRSAKWNPWFISMGKIRGVYPNRSATQTHVRAVWCYGFGCGLPQVQCRIVTQWWWYGISLIWLPRCRKSSSWFDFSSQLHCWIISVHFMYSIIWSIHTPSRWL